MFFFPLAVEDFSPTPERFNRDGVNRRRRDAVFVQSYGHVVCVLRARSRVGVADGDGEPQGDI